MKRKRNSKTLWFNGAFGILSTAISGLAFFTDVLREVVAPWMIIALLLVIALNNAINWWLRLRTSESIK